MKLSFDDEESFKEAVGSLCFDNTPSEPNTQPMGRMLPQDSERDEDICFDNYPSDHNVFRRVGSTSSLIVTAER